MSPVRRALWIIERRLSEPLTLAEIAGSVGVSPHHLAHAFARGTGLSVMHYVRARRLTIAAEVLAAGESNILNVALDAGYGSHEAFSRAFKAQFGLTPEAARRNRSVDAQSTVQAMRSTEPHDMTIENPRFENGQAMLLVGLVEALSLSKTETIAAQWQRFMAVYPAVRAKTSAPPIGVVMHMDEDGTFDYACAAEVTGISELPDGLTEMRVSPQRYVVFTHRGHATAIGETYSAIWNQWFPSQQVVPVEAASLERHLPTFDPRTGFGGVEIWIPVLQ